MSYATYAQILDQCGEVVNLNVDPLEWDAIHAEATLQINRDLDLAWYRQAASARGVTDLFDPALLDTTKLYRLGVYKALFIAFQRAARSDNESRAEMRDYWAQMYREELNLVANAGLPYNWDTDSEYEDTLTVIGLRLG